MGLNHSLIFWGPLTLMTDQHIWKAAALLWYYVDQNPIYTNMQRYDSLRLTRWVSGAECCYLLDLTTLSLLGKGSMRESTGGVWHFYIVKYQIWRYLPEAGDPAKRRRVRLEWYSRGRLEHGFGEARWRNWGVLAKCASGDKSLSKGEQQVYSKARFILA